LSYLTLLSLYFLAAYAIPPPIISVNPPSIGVLVGGAAGILGLAKTATVVVNKIAKSE